MEQKKLFGRLLKKSIERHGTCELQVTLCSASLFARTTLLDDRKHLFIYFIYLFIHQSHQRSENKNI